MPPVSLEEDSNTGQSEQTVPKPTIGIIYPPPEVRSIHQHFTHESRPTLASAWNMSAGL